MSRIVFVNGSYVPFEEANISIMDRGFLFADGIYEVSAVVNGKLVDNEAHMARLDRCLKEIDIVNPYSYEQWIEIEKELVKRNELKEGCVYMQVTRGAAERDFSYDKSIKPTVVAFTQVKNIVNNPAAETGGKAISVEDIRWARRDIKSVGLLAQVFAKQAAKEAGAVEALMVQDGYVTEGGSSTAFIIAGDKIITRPLSRAILPGITRLTVMRLANEKNLTIEERLFTLEEAFAADEAFITSATTFVMPIVSIDGKQVGSGKPGPLTKRLRALYLEMAGA
ncbi:D-amino-acid transaminase [Microvirga sp. W0021]|uniref:Probable branched-chain-amino-acid aminotransferase n=1 Tax=Hohaiivirga grylli TaxID=3133970 RepID=A0ABV0BHW5_9HYPH